MESVLIEVKKRTANDHYISTQSNKLIEAKYTLSLGEKRIMIAMVSAIKPDDKDFMEYTFRATDLAELLDINKKNIYRDIERNLFSLQEKVVHIPEEKGYFRANWISSVRKTPGFFGISFHPDLKPYLLQLKAQFTQYTLLQTRSFNSFYTIRIYEILKQYEYIGFREISVEKLRFILDVDKGTYPLFAEFRRNILDRAKKEFEEKDTNGNLRCDITFDLETVRTGRYITHLKFIIKKQKFQEILPLNIPEALPLTEAVQALVDRGINQTIAGHFEEEQGSFAILSCVEIYDEKAKAGKVSDLSGGYLLAMLKAEAGKNAEEKKKAEALKLNREKQAEEQKKKEVLYVIYEQEKDKAARDFKAGLSELELENLRVEFEGTDKYLSASESTLKMYKMSGINGMWGLAAVLSLVQEKYLPDEYRSFDDWLKSREKDKKIKR